MSGLKWLLGWTQDGDVRIFQETQEPKGFKVYAEFEDLTDAWLVADALENETLDEQK